MRDAQLGAPRQSVPFGGKQAARVAEHRFPVRIRIGIPPEGLDNRLRQMNAWLDANCGVDGWTSTPSSTQGVVNDVLAICFADARLASAFVARWCAMQRVEIVDGVYQVRDDAPTSRIGANQGDFSESRIADGLLTNRRISQANRSSESAPSG